MYGKLLINIESRLNTLVKFFSRCYHELVLKVLIIKYTIGSISLLKNVN